MAVFLVLLLAMTVVVIEGVIRCDTTAKEREMIVEDALGSLRESQDFQVIQVRHAEKGNARTMPHNDGGVFFFCCQASIVREALHEKKA